MHGIRPNLFYRWEEHVHKVKNWKCNEVEDHTHTVEKSKKLSGD
jgi:hypothetical protein